MPTIGDQPDILEFFVHHHLDPGKGIVAAFSGGVDSLGMLILLSTIVEPGKLVAVYVNHRLRDEEELKREEKQNRANCQALRVPLRIVRLTKGTVEHEAKKRGQGIEDAARHVRYHVLERVRRQLGFAYIATAHTADDQAETRIMRLFQGSRPASLEGIKAVRGAVIRPILSRNRSDMIALVQQAGLSWSQDSTNSEKRYLRNRVRHELVPSLGKVFPSYKIALERLASRCVSLEEALDGLVKQASQDVLRQNKDRIRIDIQKFLSLAPAVREHLLYHAWNRLVEDTKLPYRSLLCLLDALEKGWPDGRRMTISGTLIWRQGQYLFWKIKDESLAAGYVSWVYFPCTPLDGERMLMRGGEPDGPVPVSQRVRIDESLLAFPLIARSCRQGDEIELAEGSKRVGRLIASWHIPQQDRWRIPVLEDKHGIFAVLGGAYGGRDRVCRRLLCSTLAPKDSTLYSVIER